MLLACHVQRRIMLRQQDCTGKYFGIVFIINFENTGLLASGFLFSLKRRLILEHNVAFQQCSVRTPEATEEHWISKDLPSQGEGSVHKTENEVGKTKHSAHSSKRSPKRQQ